MSGLLAPAHALPFCVTVGSGCVLTTCLTAPPPGPSVWERGLGTAKNSVFKCCLQKSPAGLSYCSFSCCPELGNSAADWCTIQDTHSPDSRGPSARAGSTVSTARSPSVLQCQDQEILAIQKERIHVYYVTGSSKSSQSMCTGGQKKGLS